MQTESILSSAYVQGRVRSFRVMPWHTELIPAGGRPLVARAGLWTPAGSWEPNEVMFDWATIVSVLLADGKMEDRIAGMYLEYRNVADPDDVVPAPSFTRGDGTSYYDGLADSGDTDFLRVPLVAATRDTTDAANFPGGNRVTFYGQSQGAAGIHGKPFSATDNSKVFGGALVSIPDLADRTLDRVFSRFYLSGGSQQVKLDPLQIGLGWAITFG